MKVNNTTLSFFKTLWVVLTLLFFMLSAQVSTAGSHPNMYLNQAEIDAIKIKVDAKEEPWFSAYNRVMAEANAVLNAPVDSDKPYLSVTYQGRTGKIYHTRSPYCGWMAVDGQAPDCRGGQINPQADRKDYVAAIALGDVVRNLGLAYVFTGDVAYAKKVINYIRTWSINPETRMDPKSNVSIELYITMPGYFYGADLIWNYSGWDPAEKNTFRSWVKSIAETVKVQQGKVIAVAVDSDGNPNSSGLNNFANWRNVLIGAAGALLDDDELLGYTEWAWKHLISVQMNGVGSQYSGYLRQEVTRPRGLHYSLYAVNAMLQTAEIMRHRGVNLYDHVGPGGTSVRLALDFVTPFARESCVADCTWKTIDGRRQITEITQNDSMAMYELAYAYYQDPDYQEVINHWGRPMDEIRIMGLTTLTHAIAFDVNVPQVVPVIVTQPDAVTVKEGEDATFSVVATGSGSLEYQWLRGSIAIPNATSANYTESAVDSSDDGSRYRIKVSNDLGNVDSDEVTLTVQADVVAPTLISAFAANNIRVDITFSEPVSTSSAETSAHYHINLWHHRQRSQPEWRWPYR